MARVFAVASAKGGVGKTTTAANLAAVLAAADHDVVVVDADLGMPNLASALGVSPAGATVHDVLAGRADPAEAVYEGPHGLRVVAGDPDLSAFRDADPSRLRELVEAFDDAEYVVVDTSAGVSHESAFPLSFADDVVLVSTNERDALRDTEKTRELTGRLGGSVAGLVLARVAPDTNPEEAPPVDAAVLGVIPEDPKVPESVAAGEPLSSYAPASPPAVAYRELASALTGESIRPPYTDEEGAEPTLEDPEEEADGTDGDGDRKGFFSRLFG